MRGVGRGTSCGTGVGVGAHSSGEGEAWGRTTTEGARSSHAWTSSDSATRYPSELSSESEIVANGATVFLLAPRPSACWTGGGEPQIMTDSDESVEEREWAGDGERDAKGDS